MNHHAVGTSVPSPPRGPSMAHGAAPGDAAGFDAGLSGFSVGLTTAAKAGMAGCPGPDPVGQREAGLTDGTDEGPDISPELQDQTVSVAPEEVEVPDDALSICCGEAAVTTVEHVALPVQQGSQPRAESDVGSADEVDGLPIPETANEVGDQENEANDADGASAFGADHAARVARITAPEGLPGRTLVEAFDVSRAATMGTSHSVAAGLTSKPRQEGPAGDAWSPPGMILRGGGPAVFGDAVPASDDMPDDTAAQKIGVERYAAAAVLRPAVASPTPVTPASLPVDWLPDVAGDAVLTTDPRLAGSNAMLSPPPGHVAGMSPWPAHPVLTVPEGGVRRQLVEGVLRMQGDRAEIALAPEELGSVRLVLSRGDSGGSLTVWVDRPEVLEALRRNGDALLADLRNCGLDGTALDFRHGSDRQDPGWQRMADDGDIPIGLAAGESQDVQAGQGRARRAAQMAELGRLDIRV